MRAHKNLVVNIKNPVGKLTVGDSSYLVGTRLRLRLRLRLIPAKKAVLGKRQVGGKFSGSGGVSRKLRLNPNLHPASPGASPEVGLSLSLCLPPSS